MQYDWQVTAREEQWLQFLGVDFFLVGFIQIKQQHCLLCELETKTAHLRIQFLAFTKVLIFEETGRICVDLKEMKVNLVTAVFAALLMGSVQSTHHTQTVVLDKPKSTNSSTNTNGICSVHPCHFRFSMQNKICSCHN